MPNGLVQSTKMMDQFLQQFFVAFEELADRDFYIAGESYGGSWVPALAAAIAERQNPAGGRDTAQYPDAQQALSMTDRPQKINLRGIMIGNGLIRLPVQNAATLEAACSGPDALLNSSQCLEWAPRSLWCEKNLFLCETEGWLSHGCKSAHERCSEMSDLVTNKMGRNPFDWEAGVPRRPSELLS